MRVRHALLIVYVATLPQVARAEPQPFVLSLDDVTADLTTVERTPAPTSTLADRPPPAPTHAPTLGACRFEDALAHAAIDRGLDPALAIAVADAETRCRHEGQRSPKGAIGLMQLMPATARRFGARNPWNLDQNIAAGTAYLAWLHDRYGGDLVKTIAAYNAGEGAVDQHGGVPPFAETRAYVDRILKSMGASDAPAAAVRARVEPLFVIEVSPEVGSQDGADAPAVGD
ncbi:MAG: lytic transglycosylase domain-containing protein [Hyphomonadaceae bacterium]|nr:lytic transglycosylase domain-containing protein [Hyphomonadaceae bacterium]